MKNWKWAGSVAAASVFLLATHAYAEDEVTQLQKQVQQSQQQKTQLEQQKQQVDTQLSDVESQLQKVQKDLEATQSEIAKTEGDLQATQNQITAKEQELLQRQQELEKKRELLAKNVRFLYDKGAASFWEIIFGSNEISEALDRVDILNRVSVGNKKLMDNVKQLVEGTKKDKQNLEQIKQVQEAKKQDLVKLQQQQAQQQQQQTVLSVQLKGQQQKIQQDIQQEEKEMNAAEVQIVAVVKQREEEKQRQQAAEQAKQASSGSMVTPSTDTSAVKTGAGVLALPLKAGTYHVSSGYGYRIDPITGQQTLFHNGIDYAASLGTKIYAAASGEVLYAGTASGFGHWIVVACDNGLYNIYGHMYADGIHVSVGQRVTQGQYIADVGSDGESTGSHLHFGVANGFSGAKFSYVDPSLYY